MAKYRKLPVIVEAVEFVNSAECIQKLTSFMDGLVRVVHNHDNSIKLRIDTLEGEMFASEGDYIVKGINGEFYPVKPKIFKKTYELAQQNK